MNLRYIYRKKPSIHCRLASANGLQRMKKEALAKFLGWVLKVISFLSVWVGY
jgi:hypothetical protein